MRDIKFRAYHLDWKEYFEKGTDINSISYNSQFDMINLNRVLWEQNTGLKDKNGVEIYEGDIVKVISQYWGQLGNKYEVTFESGAFLVPTTTLYDIKGSVVVIGNIHENADLLEEQ